MERVGLANENQDDDMSGSEVRWAGHPDDTVVLEFRGQQDKTVRIRDATGQAWLGS